MTLEAKHVQVAFQQEWRAPTKESPHSTISWKQTRRHGYQKDRLESSILTHPLLIWIATITNIPADLKPRVRFSTPTSEVLQIHCKKQWKRGFGTSCKSEILCPKLGPKFAWNTKKPEKTHMFTDSIGTFSQSRPTRGWEIPTKPREQIRNLKWEDVENGRSAREEYKWGTVQCRKTDSSWEPQPAARNNLSAHKHSRTCHRSKQV